MPALTCSPMAIDGVRAMVRIDRDPARFDE
jgi:hypothetical protein